MDGGAKEAETAKEGFVLRREDGGPFSVTIDTGPAYQETGPRGYRREVREKKSVTIKLEKESSLGEVIKVENQGNSEYYQVGAPINQHYLKNFPDSVFVRRIFAPSESQIKSAVNLLSLPLTQDTKNQLALPKNTP